MSAFLSYNLWGGCNCSNVAMFLFLFLCMCGWSVVMERICSTNLQLLWKWLQSVLSELPFDVEDLIFGQSLRKQSQSFCALLLNRVHVWRFLLKNLVMMSHCFCSRIVWFYQLRFEQEVSGIKLESSFLNTWVLFGKFKYNNPLHSCFETHLLWAFKGVAL